MSNFYKALLAYGVLAILNLIAASLFHWDLTRAVAFTSLGVACAAFFKESE